MNVINGVGENKPKLVLICRLCGKASDSYVNIFGHEGTTRSLKKKILLYLKVEVSNSDLLPKIVCNKCFLKLEEFHNYFLASKKVQLMLKNTINESLFSIKIKIGSLTDEASSENSTKVDKENDNHISFSHNENKNRSQTNKVESICHSTRVLGKSENMEMCQNNKEMLPIDTIVNDNLDDQEIHDSTNIETRNADRNIAETTDTIYEKLSKKNSFVHTNIPDSLFHYNNNNDTNLFLNEESNNGKKLDLLVESKIETNSSDLKSVLDTDIDLMDLSIRLPCLFCTEIFMKPRELIDHFNQQHCNETPVFKCKICGSLNNDLKKFYIHYRNHKKVKYTCKICGKPFTRQWTLQLHAAVHTNVKFYNCDHCHKSYKTVNALRDHKKSHLPDECKPIYTCSYCGKSFKSKFLLKSHEKNHTGQKDFICDLCGKSYVNKSSLLYHMSIHNYKGNIKCHLCSKLVPTKKMLEQHLVTHSSNKPFKCEYCGKQYCFFSQLKLHRTLHTGELPYQCEGCPKRFRLRNALITHQRQHTGEKPFECKACDRAFTDFPNYNKHMKSKHNNTNVIERNDELILLKI